MNPELVEIAADIPRVYTAIAESLACLLFIMLLPRRLGMAATIALALVGTALMVALQLWVGMWPLALWIVGMVLAALAMYGFIRVLTKVRPAYAAYVAARAFVLAELVASVHRQIEGYYFHESPLGVRAVLLALTYSLLLTLAFLGERRHFSDSRELTVGWRGLVSTLAIAVLTFGVSNLSFVTANSPFTGRLGPEVAYIRSLVDLCGYVVLFMQHSERHTQAARHDAAVMAQMVRRQSEHFDSSRRAMDEVNRKYHDMKHLMAALRAEQDPGLRSQLLEDLSASITEYGDQVDTGNEVLDVVLTEKRRDARAHGIEASFVVDGKLLDFVAPLDLAAIVGNALDNAIEAASLLHEGKLIRVAVFAQAAFVMLRVENTYDGTVKRSGNRILTRKRGAGHGYGLRNIEAAAQRYAGSISVDAGAQWFSLRVLLPRPALDTAVRH